MTIEIKDERYFAAMWFCTPSIGGVDWHGALYKDNCGPWEFRYRFRYYADDKAHDSEDIKNWYTASFRGSEEEKHVMKLIEQMTDMVSRQFGGAPVHKIILRTSKAADVLRALEREKFAHIKRDEVGK